ncbi:MAG: EamA family transporter [Candidatus Woesebacteria bacterium]
MWLPLAILSALTAALVTIFAKLGVKTLDSTLVTTIRTVIMAVLMIGVSIGLQKIDITKLQALTGRELTFIVLSAIAGAASLLFYFAALKAGDAGKVSVIDRTSLIFIAIFSGLVLGEKFSPKSVAGIVLVVIGAILVSWK